MDARAKLSGERLINSLGERDPWLSNNDITDLVLQLAAAEVLDRSSDPRGGKCSDPSDHGGCGVDEERACDCRAKARPDFGTLSCSKDAIKGLDWQELFANVVKGFSLDLFEEEFIFKLGDFED